MTMLRTQTTCLYFAWATRNLARYGWAIALLSCTSLSVANELHGDRANGQHLIATCLGCHGMSGYHNAYPSYRIPRIAGQSETYLYHAMLDYRSGKRDNPTMHAQMQHNTDQQLADIAAYLAHSP